MENTTIVIEKQWTVNNPHCKDPIYIYTVQLCGVTTRGK